VLQQLRGIAVRTDHGAVRARYRAITHPALLFTTVKQLPAVATAVSTVTGITATVMQAAAAAHGIMAGTRAMVTTGNQKK